MIKLLLVRNKRDPDMVEIYGLDHNKKWGIGLGMVHIDMFKEYQATLNPVDYDWGAIEHALTDDGECFVSMKLEEVL